MATETTPASGGKITRRDVIWSWVLWTFFSHANYNYERLQATAFAHAMTPIIRKLYHTPDSRYYKVTKAEVWFDTEANAEAAGFAKPGTQKDED